MIPVVFINCKSVPYVDMIISGKKLFETRNRNTLKSLAYNYVYIAETGKGCKPMIKAVAALMPPVAITSRDMWRDLRRYTRVPVKSEQEWNKNTNVKYIYELRCVQPVPVPFPLPDNAVRHGRVWAEYNEEEN